MPHIGGVEVVGRAQPGFEFPTKKLFRGRRNRRKKLLFLTPAVPRNRKHSEFRSELFRGTKIEVNPSECCSQPFRGTKIEVNPSECCSESFHGRENNSEHVYYVRLKQRKLSSHPPYPIFPSFYISISNPSLSKLAPLSLLVSLIIKQKEL
jgi:hypothetical protein